VQACGILAADFVHADTVLLRRLCALIVIGHGTRFTSSLDAVFTAAGITILTSPPQAPRAKGHLRTDDRHPAPGTP